MLLSQGIEHFENLLGMAIDLDCLVDLGHVPLGINDKRAAGDPHPFFAVEGFLSPRTIGLGNAVIRVGEQRKG